MLDRISDLSQRAQKAFASVKTLEDLQSFQTEFLSKKSELATLSKSLGSLSEEERRQIGPHISKLRTEITDQFTAKQAQLEKAALDEKLASDWIDVTAKRARRHGALHPLSQVQRRIEDIFTSMGFEIYDGPEVETEWHNFDALNIPGTHPARDMQDTFWIDKNADNPHENSVLRTHTSNLQIRKMLEHGAPVRIIVPGRVYRNEAVDMTHDATFYQVEGLVVDKGISLAHLKGTLETMLSAVFEKDITVRLRPGYFPFVEPGLEVDIWFEYTDKNGDKQGRWLEFSGAGMVHPNVLRNSGVDPDEYSGFAFGFGLTRLTMMRYAINDIRLLFSSKQQFLSQF